MSRIGKEPVTIPSGVEVTVADGNVTVKGPNGTLSQQVDPAIAIEVDGDQVRVSRPNDERRSRALHGLTRALIANMVVGVTDGFVRSLEIVGVGYRAQARGSNGLTLQLGYSHNIDVDAPEGISFEVPTPTKIMVKGSDKQAVGQMAADIRALRKPEPYKGKGIRYEGELVRRKAGKAAGA